MGRYPNGYIPDSALVTFHTGWSQADKDFKWQLPPSTYRKHLALVARAKKRTGRVLSPSQGWSCNRPYRAQTYARQMYGTGAATPGTSSHGGFWEGKDTAAIDYGNWGYVYDWNRDAFYADCRAVGLTPGQIHPSRNRTYPDEPWHVIDLDPWAAVPSGGSFIPEEDDMTPEQANQLNQIYSAIFKGGPSMEDKGRSVSYSLNNITQFLSRIDGNVAPIRRDGVSVPLRQEIADTKTKVIGMEAAISALALAKGADPDAILKAVQDGVEAAMRKVTFSADVDG